MSARLDLWRKSLIQDLEEFRDHPIIHNALLAFAKEIPMPKSENQEREQASTGAVRSQLYPKGAKFPARYDLMMRNAAGMRRLAETWGEGQAKYGNDNWLNGFPESVMISHTEDHIRLYLAGDKSEDHLAHAAWNLLALCWIEENKPELLDLTKPEQKL